MKYQIYLNKETTEKINLIAQLLEQKPSTTIKNLLEKSLGEMIPPTIKGEITAILSDKGQDNERNGNL